MRKITNLFFLFLLVFIGFFSGRFAVSTHINSYVTLLTGSERDDDGKLKNYKAKKKLSAFCIQQATFS